MIALNNVKPQGVISRVKALNTFPKNLKILMLYYTSITKILLI